MTQTPIIFCSPHFLETLSISFPDSLILPFSDAVEKSESQIAALDSQDQRQAWLLFQATDIHHHNSPVTDHINLSTKNTLIGPADLSKGPRFPDMSSVYEHNGEGVLVVLGQDSELANFDEMWAPVSAGVWEAIALKHRGYKIHGWLVANLDEWINEKTNL